MPLPSLNQTVYKLSNYVNSNICKYKLYKIKASITQDELKIKLTFRETMFVIIMHYLLYYQIIYVNKRQSNVF